MPTVTELAEVAAKVGWRLRSDRYGTALADERGHTKHIQVHGSDNLAYCLERAHTSAADGDGAALAVQLRAAILAEAKAKRRAAKSRQVS
jgi:ketosteroid isomerase-like protein